MVTVVCTMFFGSAHTCLRWRFSSTRVLLLVGFVVVALFVAYAMYPAIRPFDYAKVGPMPEYSGPGSPECF